MATIAQNVERPGRLASFVVAAAVALLLPAGTSAQTSSAAPRTLTLSEYREELDRCLGAVERRAEHPEEARALRAQLPPLWPVMAEGQRFEVSTSWLKAGLEALEKNPQAPEARLLPARLKALRQDAQLLAETRPVAEDAARARLQAILARPEYENVHEPTWLDRLNERFKRWLTELLENLSLRLSGHPRAVKVVFWLVFALAAGALMVWMVARLLRPRAVSRLAREAPVRAVEGWQPLLSEARAAAGHGNYRDAIRWAYWAGIVRLEEAGLWTRDRARTPREYLRLLAPGQPQREPLAALTRHFELAWYAGRETSAGDFTAVLSDLERLGCVFPSTQAIGRS